MVCTICNGKCAKERELYDDRFGYPGKFELVKCADCGHRELLTGFSEKEIRGLYSEYYPRSSYTLESHRPYKVRTGPLAWLDGSRASAFRWVPERVRVLDIGCGFGETLGYHAARGCDVFGVEADENIKRVAERYGYRVHVGLFDPAIYEKDFFDYVTLDQVFEHLKDPLKALRGVVRALRPGGRMIISVPNAHGWGVGVFGDKWINWHAPYHLQFFSARSLEMLAGRAGFEIEKIKTITPSDWLCYQWQHLIFYPHEGKPSAYWTGKMAPSQKAVEFFVRVFHKTKLDHLLTRLFDAMGLGDNMVIVLKKQGNQVDTEAVDA